MLKLFPGDRVKIWQFPNKQIKLEGKEYVGLLSDAGIAVGKNLRIKGQILTDLVIDFICYEDHIFVSTKRAVYILTQA